MKMPFKIDTSLKKYVPGIATSPCHNYFKHWSGLLESSVIVRLIIQIKK